MPGQPTLDVSRAIRGFSIDVRKIPEFQQELQSETIYDSVVDIKWVSISILLFSFKKKKKYMIN